MKNAYELRKDARLGLKGKWLAAMVTGVVACLLGATGMGLIDFNYVNHTAGGEASLTFAGFNLYSIQMDQIREMGAGAITAGTASAFFAVAVVLLVLQMIVGCVVSIGYARYNMDLADRKDVKLGTLLDYFPNWKNLLAAGLLQGLFVILWSLLFVIPGVIAAFRYSMTSYILAQNPEMPAMEAIARSKEMMKGNKWRLFCLHLSFIGWSILCKFTLGIGHLFLNPYRWAADAAFYNDLAGHQTEEVKMEEVKAEEVKVEEVKTEEVVM